MARHHSHDLEDKGALYGRIAEDPGLKLVRLNHQARSGIQGYDRVASFNLETAETDQIIRVLRHRKQAPAGMPASPYSDIWQILLPNAGIKDVETFEMNPKATPKQVLAKIRQVFNSNDKSAPTMTDAQMKATFSDLEFDMGESRTASKPRLSERITGRRWGMKQHVAERIMRDDEGRIKDPEWIGRDGNRAERHGHRDAQMFSREADVLLHDAFKQVQEMGFKSPDQAAYAMRAKMAGIEAIGFGEVSDTAVRDWISDEIRRAWCVPDWNFDDGSLDGSKYLMYTREGDAAVDYFIQKCREHPARVVGSDLESSVKTELELISLDYPEAADEAVCKRVCDEIRSTVPMDAPFDANAEVPTELTADDDPVAAAQAFDADAAVAVPVPDDGSMDAAADAAISAIDANINAAAADMRADAALDAAAVDTAGTVDAVDAGVQIAPPGIMPGTDDGAEDFDEYPAKEAVAEAVAAKALDRILKKKVQNRA